MIQNIAIGFGVNIRAFVVAILGRAQAVFFIALLSFSTSTAHAVFAGVLRGRCRRGHGFGRCGLL